MTDFANVKDKKYWDGDLVVNGDMVVRGNLEIRGCLVTVETQVVYQDRVVRTRNDLIRLLEEDILPKG